MINTTLKWLIAILGALCITTFLDKVVLYFVGAYICG